MLIDYFPFYKRKNSFCVISNSDHPSGLEKISKSIQSSLAGLPEFPDSAPAKHSLFQISGTRGLPPGHMAEVLHSAKTGLHQKPQTQVSPIPSPPNT